MTIDNDLDAHRPHQSIHSVGALLREARESLGLELSDVARNLRIRFPYLQGIENDDYARLPGKTYVLGFLRSYAEFLGLDGDDVVSRYRRQLDDKALPAPSLHFPLRHSQARLPRGAIVLLSVVLAAAAVYGGSRFLENEELQTVDRVAPVPERLIAETRPTPPPVLVPRNDPSSAFAAVTPQPTETSLAPLEPSPPPAAVAAGEPAAAPSGMAGVAPATEPPAGSQTATQTATQVASAELARAMPAVPPMKPPRPAAPQPTAQATQAPPPVVAQQQAQATPTAAAPANAPQSVATQLTDTQTAALAAEPPKPRDVMVVARVDSWIEVRDSDNRPLVSLLLRVGDSYRVPEGANYRLVTGDVRGLEVRVDGMAVRQRGTDDNKPHRMLSLDGERLRAGSAVLD